MLFLSLSISALALAQEPDTTSTPTPASDPATDYYSTEDYAPESGADNAWADGDGLFKPTLGLGAGMFTFYGDYSSYKNYKTNHPLTSRVGYDLRITQPITKWLDGSFYVLWGRLGANERSLERNLNFESRVTIGGMNVAVNFGDLINENPDRIFEPYVSVGFESVEFLSKTDLIDAYGNTYHYWSDGSIRNMAEDATNSGEAVRIQRDFVYESDIRELNLDGFGKYPERSFAVPIGVGGNLHISPKFKFRIGTTLHYTFTDHVDGITAESVGVRAGDKRPDMFLFSSFNISYNLVGGRQNKSKWDESLFLDAPPINIETEDADQDGVFEIADDCPDTELGVEVDENGCPKDEDKDGVPDYIDMELGTPQGSLVDEDGRAITDEMLERQYALFSDSLGVGDMKIVRSEYIHGVTNVRQGPGYYVQMGEFVGRLPADFADVLLGIEDLQIIERGDTSMIVIGELSTLDEAVQRKLRLIRANLPDADNVSYADAGSVYQGTVKAGKDEHGFTIVEEGKLPIAEDTGEPLIDPNQVVYRIQVGAFGKKMNQNIFAGVPSVSGITSTDGMTRYFSGSYTSFTEAATAKIDLVAKGYSGAFIVPFKGGARIRLAETEATLAEDYDPNAPKSVGGVNKDLVRFRIQVGAYEAQIPTDVLDQFMTLGSVEARLAPDGRTKYVVGSYENYDAALQFKNDVVNQGFGDAFVVGEFDNKILSAAEALQLLK